MDAKKIKRITPALFVIFVALCFVMDHSDAKDPVALIEEALDEYEEGKGNVPPSRDFRPASTRSSDTDESRDLSMEPGDMFSDEILFTDPDTDSPLAPGIVEISPPPDNRFTVTIEGEKTEEDFSADAIIDVLQLKDMNIVDVLKLIAQKSNLNIIAGQEVRGKISIYLKNVKLKDALRIILDSNGLAYKVEEGIIRIMPAQEFENRYGYKFGGNIQTEVVRLLYVEAGDVVSILEQIKSVSGKIIFDAKSNTLILMESPEKLAIMKRLIHEVDIPIETRFFELNYAVAKDIVDKISESLTRDVGTIKYDDRSNKIVVTDTPSRLEKIAALIEAFDVKEQQVLIEAKILQVILSDQYKYGVDWQAILETKHDFRVFSDFDIISSNDKFGKISVGTLETDRYTAFIEALEAVGETNILSSPSITALNNQEAKILVGSTEPYVTTTTTIPSSGPSITAESVTFIDVGVKLYVTPTIHRDGFITMKIKPEVSSVTSTITTSNNNTIPVVDTSEAETTVMVKDGVTIVIGGLIKEEQLESRNKIPFLGDIPVLGYIFRNDDRTTRKTEIVIFLTPKIVSGDIPEDRSLDFLTGLP